MTARLGARLLIWVVPEEPPMKILAYSRGALRVSLLVAVAFVSTTRGYTQDRSLTPTFGSVELHSGFVPDPYVKNVVAGGPIQTNLGGVKSQVANAPDFKLYFTAGRLPLTIYVESAADTTLLINLPDGTWVADDDSGGNLNPLLRFNNPQSGRYDIWVGTYRGGNPPATLKISELR
jgi:hypothetical protein